MTEEDCINNVGLDMVKKEAENQLTNIALSNLIPICQGKSQSESIQTTYLFGDLDVGTVFVAIT